MIARRKYLHLVALLSLIGGIVALSYQYRYVSDWTHVAKHSLSPASTTLLDSMSEPIRVTCYIGGTHPARPRVAEFVARYSRHHQALEFNFIDPATEPQLVRDNDIAEGEIIIEYKGQSERVAKLIEQQFSNALARLARNTQRYIVFLSGHGERSPTREANHDVSDWAAVLSSRGLNVQEINLSQVNAIPDNTSLVVIASPQLPYLKAELRLVANYVSEGGNLLWLSDPEEPKELSALADVLEVSKIPGTLVDPASLAKGLENPALLLASTYSAHPSLSGFNLTTLFIYASAFTANVDSHYTASGLVESGSSAWSETSKLEGDVGMDEETDFPGPLPLVLALERTQTDNEQRIIISGDGDFLANTYLANAGNQDFGVRLVEWLISDENLINVPSKMVADRELSFEKWHTAVIGFGFLLVIPGALLLNGFLIWKKRQRA